MSLLGNLDDLVILVEVTPKVIEDRERYYQIMSPHDARCEDARNRAAGWPRFRGCGCSTRRLRHSLALAERPVRWSWLHGPEEE